MNTFAFTSDQDIITKEMIAIKARQDELLARILRTKDQKRRDDYRIAWIQLNHQLCVLSRGS